MLLIYHSKVHFQIFFIVHNQIFVAGYLISKSSFQIKNKQKFEILRKRNKKG